jgi:ribosomal protein S18 acetylase RimI-like enzyme
MEITVRLAEPKDAAQIAKVHVETWQSAYRGQIPQSYLDSLSVEDRKKKWDSYLAKPEENATTIIGVVDGKIVGFCSVDKTRSDDMDETTGELWAIYVDRDYAGKGVGSALHDKGMNILRERGFKKAILWVLTSNDVTRQWYEKKGWKVEGKTIVDPEHGLNLHETRYIKTL